MNHELATLSPEKFIDRRGVDLSRMMSLSVAEMLQLGEMLVKTGFLPDSVKTAGQATAIILKGQELGVPPMYALSNIHIIGNKPACSAELMMNLVRRAYGASAIRVVPSESDEKRATIEYRERGWDGTQRATFSLQDAMTAGLTGKDIWKKYPKAMLRSRAISMVCKQSFPECIAGMYTPEELDAQVMLDDDEIITIAATPDQRPRPQTPMPPQTPPLAPEPITVPPTEPQPEPDPDLDDDVPPGEEEEPVLVPEDAETKTAAMGALHAEAAEKGLDHDDLHLVSYNLFPVLHRADEAGNAIVVAFESMADLTLAELTSIQNRVRAADPETIGYLATNWSTRMEAAENQAQLHKYVRQMRLIGVTGGTHPHYNATYKRCLAAHKAARSVVAA